MTSAMPELLDEPTRSGAASLAHRERLIVTLDGPAGPGKSTVARDVAIQLGLEFLDTGSMYRAAAALSIDNRVDASDEEAVADLVRAADLRFEWAADPPTLLAFGRPIADRLRDTDVTALVSPVSSLAAVRRVLVERQRRIGEVHPRLVSEGRDQGSVVFFDADVKIYLDASPRVRARRRAEQLHSIGRQADAAAIEQELAERDRRDSTRAVGPLVCPPDAVRLDTSDLDQPAVVRRLAEIVLSRLALAAH